MSRDERTVSLMSVRSSALIQPPLYCGMFEQVSVNLSLINLNVLAHFDYRLSSSALSAASHKGTLRSFPVLPIS